MRVFPRGRFRLCSIFLPLVLAPCRFAAEQVQAVPCDAVSDLVGVNVHLSNGPSLYYKNWSLTRQALIDLGVRHVRDSVIVYANQTDTTIPYVARYRELASLGIRGLFSTTMGQTAEQISGFRAQIGGDDGIEYPNEQDGNIPGLVLYSATLAGTHALIGPSFASPSNFSQLGPIAMDFGNLHNYFGGRNPGTAGWGDPDSHGARYGSMAYQTNAIGTARPIWVTETGIETGTGKGDVNWVSEQMAAVYMPRLILESWRAGYKRIYLYELLEGNAQQFGLIDRNGRRKPMFTAAARLVNLLRNQGAAFDPGTLDFTLSGAGPNVHTLLMRRRDGSYYLAIWNEVQGWEPDKHYSIPVPALQVTLQTDVDWSICVTYQWDDTGNVHTAQLTPSHALSLTVTDRLQIVKLYSPGLKVGPAH